MTLLVQFSPDGRQIQGSRLTLFLRVDPLRNIRDSRGHTRKKELLQRLRKLEAQHFPGREVYTHAEWMEDVYRYGPLHEKNVGLNADEIEVLEVLGNGVVPAVKIPLICMHQR